MPGQLTIGDGVKDGAGLAVSPQRYIPADYSEAFLTIATDEMRGLADDFVEMAKDFLNRKHINTDIIEVTGITDVEDDTDFVMIRIRAAGATGEEAWQYYQLFGPAVSDWVHSLSVQRRELFTKKMAFQIVPSRHATKHL